MIEPNGDSDSIEVCNESRAGVVGRSEAQMSISELTELVDLVAFILDERGVGAVEVGLYVVDEGAIAALNDQHMGVGGPTDVLSFPIDEDIDPSDPSPRMLGDIVLCPQVAAESQRTTTSGLEDELRLLVVHGTLHLLGMDHGSEPDRLAMSEAQNDLRNQWADRTGQPRPEPVQLEARDDEGPKSPVEVKG